mmetsp:Transcript_4238/g.4242  ORF Transcript_4238/g.4242 Transcript_4238/m.4242 type:complete len:397 (+) Transcript_4238:70-1260(+)
MGSGLSSKNNNKEDNNINKENNQESKENNDNNPPLPGHNQNNQHHQHHHNNHNNHNNNQKKYQQISQNKDENNIDIENQVKDNNNNNNNNSLMKEKTIITSKNVGRVVIKSLNVTYRHDLPPVLKNLSIDIPAGCKVGICGRTGSGKSSLLQALLRLNIITSGDILVDDISLLSLSLEDSRSLISLIPQDPHLFSGTVRFNIDPFNQHSDEEIWDALRDAQLYDYIKSSETKNIESKESDENNNNNNNSNSNPSSGLDMIVEEGGRNFSVGQRQLLSLARAIVRRGKVILMDEVTASIDYMTDKAIQDTIRTSSALCSATIITIAHRLRTIADSDLIGFIDEGTFVEIGRPYDLLRKRSSNFRKLAEESNEFDDILSIAKNKVKESELNDNVDEIN